MCAIFNGITLNGGNVARAVKAAKSKEKERRTRNVILVALNKEKGNTVGKN